MSDKNSGLARKLLMSHLAIAAIGVALLTVSLAAVFWLRQNTVQLAWRSVRAEEASSVLLNGVQQSLAALRGWVVLGREDFKKERAEAWERKIWPSLQRLEKLESQPELRRMIQQLENVQWWIEDAAQTPGNFPARLLFQEKIRPISENIFELVTQLIDEEKNQGGSLDRKLLLGSLGDFRGMAIYSEQYLRDFIENGKEADEKEFRRYLSASQEELRGLLQ